MTTTKRFLRYVLTLAMVFGMFVGISATAKAEIKYYSGAVDLTEDVTISEDTTWYFTSSGSIRKTKTPYITITIPEGKTLIINSENDSDKVFIQNYIIFDVKGTLVLNGNVSDDLEDQFTGTGTVRYGGTYKNVEYLGAQNQYLISKLLASEVDTEITLGKSFNEEEDDYFRCATSSYSASTGNTLTISGANALDLNGWDIEGYQSLNTIKVPYGARLDVRNSYTGGNYDDHRQDDYSYGGNMSRFITIMMNSSFDCFQTYENVSIYDIKYEWFATVSYNAGEDATNVPKNKEYGSFEYDLGEEEVTVAIDEKVPQREGFTFLGWKDAYTNKVYQPGDEDITLYSRNLVLNAEWRNDQKTVTYNMNDAKETAPEKKEYIVGAAVQIPIDLKPTKTGYTFQYWRSNFEGNTYDPGDVFYMPNTDVTLTAVFTKDPEPVTTYTVTYNVNSAVESAPASEKYAEGDIVKISDAKLTREGYTFLYWLLIPEVEKKDVGLEEIQSTISPINLDSFAKYAPGSTFEMPANNVTLLACWQENEEVVNYTVTFDTKTEGAKESVSTLTEVAEGSCITLPSGLTKKNYTFKGWYIKETLYAAGSSYQVKAEDISGDTTEIIAIAHFSPVAPDEKYSVRYFDKNGELFLDKTKYEEDSYDAVVKPYPSGEEEADTDTDSGYFQYWRSNYDGKIYKPGDILKMPGSDVTLTAVFKYPVTYDVGDANVQAPATELYEEGDTVKVSDAKLIWKNHTFLGWYRVRAEDIEDIEDIDLEDRVDYVAGSSFTMPEAEVTLLAVWKENDKTYSVTFDENGANEAFAPMNDLAKGSYITLPSGLSKDDYVFTGWTINGKLYGAGGKYQVNADVTATASFKKITKETVMYTVSYKANGGSNAPESAKYEAGSVQTVAKAPAAKDGYIFTGYLNSYTGTVMQPGEMYTLKGNTTFTARWTTKVAETILPCKGISGNKKVKLSWIKVKGAYAYEVYASYCDNSLSEMIKATKGLTYTVKKLKNNKCYKYYVKAYKLVDGKKVYLATSPEIHVAMKDNKCTNVKSMTVNKKAVTLSVGKTAKIKASLKKQKASKAYLKHGSSVRYYSVNSKIATVGKTGVIKAVKAGTTYIYVVAKNGIYKKVKVTVK